MNIQKMIKDTQRKLVETQAALATMSVEASVGGGKVKVTANGAGEITSIKIDPQVVDPQDVEMLEDLVLTGVKQALEDAKKVASDEMGKVTGGLNIPGLSF